MIEKHAKMDFREGIFGIKTPENGEKFASYPASAVASETEFEDHTCEGGDSRKKSKAERTLEGIIQQSSLDPWQRDTLGKAIKPNELHQMLGH